MFALDAIERTNKYDTLPLMISVIVVLVVCVGCQRPQPPLSYTSLCGVSTEQMQELNDSGVRSWIERVHGSYQPLNIDQMLPEEDKGHVTAYTWGDPLGYTGEVFLRDGKVMRFSQHNVEQEVTIGEVVAYFGSPEWILKHATIRERVLYIIEFDYPNQGFSIGTTAEKDPNQLIHDGKLAIKLEENARVDWVDCFRSSSIQDVLRYDFFIPPDATVQTMGALERWPGFGAYLPLTK